MRARLPGWIALVCLVSRQLKIKHTCMLGPAAAAASCARGAAPASLLRVQLHARGPVSPCPTQCPPQPEAADARDRGCSPSCPRPTRRRPRPRPRCFGGLQHTGIADACTHASRRASVPPVPSASGPAAATECAPLPYHQGEKAPKAKAKAKVWIADAIQPPPLTRKVDKWLLPNPCPPLAPSIRTYAFRTPLGTTQDPNAPKKPVGSYLIFSKDKREEVGPPMHAYVPPCVRSQCYPGWTRQ